MGCSVCFEHQAVATLFANKRNQLPAICTESGTVPRKEMLVSHLELLMHKECVKMQHVDKLKLEDHYMQATPLVKQMFNEQQQKLETYLSDRTQHVRMGETSSSPSSVGPIQLPQGSVLYRTYIFHHVRGRLATTDRTPSAHPTQLC